MIFFSGYAYAHDYYKKGGYLCPSDIYYGRPKGAVLKKEIKTLFFNNRILHICEILGCQIKFCAVSLMILMIFFSVAMLMHMIITKKEVTFAHLIFIMAGPKGQLILMENGK